MGVGAYDARGFRTPEGRYTNLALILSDMCPWHIEIRVSGMTIETLTGSAVKQLGEATRTTVAVRRELAEMRGVELEQMQVLVVAEALLNAVSHRSYCSPDPIVVDVEVCHVRVTSPGG